RRPLDCIQQEPQLETQAPVSQSNSRRAAEKKTPSSRDYTGRSKERGACFQVGCFNYHRLGVLVVPEHRGHARCLPLGHMIDRVVIATYPADQLIGRNLVSTMEREALAARVEDRTHVAIASARQQEP